MPGDRNAAPAAPAVDRGAARERRDKIRALGDMRRVLDRCGLLEMADALDARLSAVEAERDGLVTAMRECLDRINKANEAGVIDCTEADPAEILAEFVEWNEHNINLRKSMSASVELWQDRWTDALAERDAALAKIEAARIVADHWRQACMDGTPDLRWAAHPLCMVLTALEGEMDPAQVGVIEDSADASALRALAGSGDRAKDQAE